VTDALAGGGRGRPWDDPLAGDRNGDIIVYPRRFIVRGESWFHPRPPAADVDVLVQLHQAQALAGHRCRKAFTILIDLSQSEQTLFAAISAKTRNQIRAAAKGCTYEHWDAPEPALIDAFCDEFDAFAIGPAIDRIWIAGAARAGRLRLSRTASPDGMPLTKVIHLQAGDYVCERYALSLFRRYDDPRLRKLAGDAHRFQVWRDMLSFKAAGARVYDLGGWYGGTTDAGLLRINAFKERFGGRIVTVFNCERAVSARGRLYVTAKRAFRAVKRLAQSSAARRENPDLGY